MTAIARNTLALAALSAASCRPTGEISLNNDLRTIDEITDQFTQSTSTQP